MLDTEQDWAALCRRYRLHLGLKQEALAQDLRVDQSTVSRWERGLREPPHAIKQTILNTLIDSGAVAPDRSLQMLLDHSASAVALWYQAGVLRGLSRRFDRELRATLGDRPLIGRSADELLQGHPIMRAALAALSESGFFQGSVRMAHVTFRPLLHPGRKDLGGVVTGSIFPMPLTAGKIGMLTLYDHDVLGDPPDAQDLATLTWIDAGDGHMQRRNLRPEPA